jgi:hypothetical protein
MSIPRLLTASLNPSSELLVLSMVTVEEAEPITIVMVPDAIGVVVFSYPLVISLLSVARLLTIRE